MHKTNVLYISESELSIKYFLVIYDPILALTFSSGNRSRHDFITKQCSGCFLQGLKALAGFIKLLQNLFLLFLCFLWNGLIKNKNRLFSSRRDSLTCITSLLPHALFLH